MSESNNNIIDVEQTACITCNHILENNAAVLFVSRDDDDEMCWQFLCGGEHEAEDARIISLQQIIDIDNSLLQLLNIPVGSSASRNNINAEWEI